MRYVRNNLEDYEKPVRGSHHAVQLSTNESRCRPQPAAVSVQSGEVLLFSAQDSGGIPEWRKHVG